MHLDKAVALGAAGSVSAAVEVVDGFLHGAAHGAHGDDHVCGIRRSVVVEGMVAAARHGGAGLHDVFDYAGQLAVGAVVGLAHLEVDVAVLHGGTQAGVLRVERMRAEALQGALVHEF